MRPRALIIISLLFCTHTAAAEDTPPATAADTATNTASSTAQPAPSTPRTEPNPDQDRLLSLRQQIQPGTELIELDTGKQGEKMTALYQPEGRGAAQGGILLFPDQSTHMDWPDAIRTLRSGLADQGWNTLALYLPNPKPEAIPKRTLPVLSSIKPAAVAKTNTASAAEPTSVEKAEAEQPAPSSANNTEPSTETPAPAKPDTAENIRLLSVTAYNFLKGKLGENDRVIVAGIGTGAVWAADYVLRNEANQNLRLLMIDARNLGQANSPDIMKILPELKSPVIDMHHGPALTLNPDLRTDTPSQRARLARHKQLTNYQQRRLPAAEDNWKRHNPRLLKEVRGAIQTYILDAERLSTATSLESTPSESEQAPGKIKQAK